jgi:hypothetical protein
MSNTQGSFNARFELDPDDPHPEQRRANGDQLTSIGRQPGEQVRIEFRAANPNAILGAIFTISPSFLSDVKRVILGKRIVNLNNCQLSGSVCEGEVKAQIMIEGLDENEGRQRTWANLLKS